MVNVCAELVELSRELLVQKKLYRYGPRDGVANGGGGDSVCNILGSTRRDGRPMGARNR